MQKSRKEGLSAKRIIYTICFIILNFIDFVRNTQNGDLWRTAANATGLVMMIIIFTKVDFRKRINIFSIVWSLLCFGICIWSVQKGGGAVFQMYFLAFAVAVLNVWWMVLLLPYFIKRRKKYFNKKPGPLAIMAIITTLLMTFSKSERDWPIWFLIMFTYFYHLDFTGEEKKDLMNGMIDGTILSFFALQIFAYGFRPYDTVRYAGAFINCNMTALHYLVVYVVLLIRIHQLHMEKGKVIFKIICYLLAAGMLGFQFLTMGRTAWVCSLIITPIYGILVMGRNWGYSVKKILLQAALFGVSVLLCFPLVFYTVRYLPTILHHPIWFGAEYSEEKVHSFDPADSEKYVELDEFLTAVFGRVLHTFDKEEKEEQSSVVRMDRLVLGGVCDMQELSLNFMRQNGILPKQETKEIAPEDMEVRLTQYEGLDGSIRTRLMIYSLYIKELNLWGHGENEGHYKIVNEGRWVLTEIWHAQNLWLQIAFSYGIPAGIMVVFISVTVFLKSIAKAVKEKENPLSIIPLFVCLTFFLFGTMEVVWNVGQLIFFMIFFVMILFTENKEVALEKKDVL